MSQRVRHAVSTGHNFCRQCVLQFLTSTAAVVCCAVLHVDVPLCAHTINSRPWLCFVPPESAKAKQTMTQNRGSTCLARLCLQSKAAGNTLLCLQV